MHWAGEPQAGRAAQGGGPAAPATMPPATVQLSLHQAEEGPHPWADITEQLPTPSCPKYHHAAGGQAGQSPYSSLAVHSCPHHPFLVHSKINLFPARLSPFNNIPSASPSHVQPLYAARVTWAQLSGREIPGTRPACILGIYCWDDCIRARVPHSPGIHSRFRSWGLQRYQCRRMPQTAMCPSQLFPASSRCEEKPHHLSKHLPIRGARSTPAQTDLRENGAKNKVPNVTTPWLL